MRSSGVAARISPVREVKHTLVRCPHEFRVGVPRAELGKQRFHFLDHLKGADTDYDGLPRARLSKLVRNTSAKPKALLVVLPKL